MPKKRVNGIWERTWQREGQVLPQDIVYSRFTVKAFQSFKHFVSGEDGLILEAGCGTGRLCCLLAKEFPAATVIGIDTSPQSLVIARHIKAFLGVTNVSFAQADLFYLPYRDNCFDVVFNDGVIEHFSLTDYPNYKDALREMVRVAKPGGKIIVDVPNWHCFAHTLYKWVLKKTGKKYEYGYEKSFRRNELIDLFKEFNLTHLELQSYDSAHGVYRLRAYSRLFSWLGLALYALDTPALANRIGYMVLIKGIKPLT